jgi:hypothetical protein
MRKPTYTKIKLFFFCPGRPCFYLKLLHTLQINKNSMSGHKLLGLHFSYVVMLLYDVTLKIELFRDLHLSGQKGRDNHHILSIN